MASLSIERNSRKLFNGDKEPGRSTREAPEANARGSRCRDQIEAYGRQFDTNDRFVLLTDLLEGGAGSQADQLHERMQKELDARNAMELAEYKDSVAMHPL
jgi:hypothetical protein